MKVLKKINNYFSLFKRGSYSNAIRLEACSICQLKCPICSTGKGKNKKGIVGWGYLKFWDFKNLLKRNTWIKNIELSNWGEIFLNPELKDIVEFAYSKNVSLKAGNGVNLNHVEENVIECLVKYKFKYISISIDGTNNHTYKTYRIGGDFDQVIFNIYQINYYKKKYHSDFPKLCWQFVIFGHNEHELPIAREMAKSLEMDFKPKLNWDSSFLPIKDKELVRRESGLTVSSREEYQQKTKRAYKIPCKQLWNEPQINWDGKLLGCCVNIYSDYGNVFELDLEECLKSEKYAYTKEMLLGKAELREDIPCYKCQVLKYVLDSEILKNQVKI